MAAMSVSLNNGERTVVLLFISCVLFSLPLSLLYQGFALCLLTLAGVFVEVSAENSTSLSRFKTRPGASSGILLGAVTLPAVMFSRLIQLSRAVASYDVGTEEVGYLNMQYWAVSASCFSVLVLLHLVSRHSSSNTGSSWLGSFQDRKFGIICIPLYATVCCMSLATNSHGGFHVAMELLWVLSHGLAAVKLIQHILRTFPSCASIGEALLVSAGLALYFGDVLAYTFGKIIAYSISSRLLSLQFGSKRSEIGTIIQGVLFGLLLFPILYKFILQIWAHFISIDYTEACTADERTSKGIGRSLLFYASLAVTLVVIVPTWMQFVQDFHVHPLSWVFTFVFMEPFKRLALCIYWIGVICLSVVRFYNISKNSKIERVLLRKYYHMVAVLMFVPAIIFEPNFLDLAFGVALAVFLALEIVRYLHMCHHGVFYKDCCGENHMVPLMSRMFLLSSSFSYKCIYTFCHVSVGTVKGYDSLVTIVRNGFSNI